MYTITNTVSSAESEKEQLRLEAAKAVYNELLKYITDKSPAKSA